jgi:hypothetical protein
MEYFLSAGWNNVSLYGHEIDLIRCLTEGGVTDP